MPHPRWVFDLRLPGGSLMMPPLPERDSGCRPIRQEIPAAGGERGAGRPAGALKKDDLLKLGMVQGIAVLSLTLLVIAWIPFLGPAVLILTPLPLIHTFRQLGRIKGWLALGISYALVLGSLKLLGRPLPIAVFLMIGLGGVLLSEVLRRRYSIEKTVALASLGLFVAGGGLLSALALQSGVPLWSLVEGYVDAVIGENLRLYGQMNISPEQWKLIEANRPQITQLIVGIFPSLALAGAIFAVWLNILGGRLILGGKGDSWFAFDGLCLWKAPERLVWLFILAGALVLLVPWDLPAAIGLNLLILCSLIYFFQGMAIASYLFQQRRIPVALRWLFYVILAVQQYMAILVVLFGLFDIWIDFRKRITKSDSPG